MKKLIDLFFKVIKNTFFIYAMIALVLVMIGGSVWMKYSTSHQDTALSQDTSSLNMMDDEQNTQNDVQPLSSTVHSAAHTHTPAHQNDEIDLTTIQKHPEDHQHLPYRPYAPFTPQKNNPSSLTLIVTDLGLDPSITERAIRELPSSVVLAFSSFAKTINQWIHPARTAGHDLLLELNEEKNADHINILTYFDGVLLMDDGTPVTSKKGLRRFLEDIEDKKKFIVEGRLLRENNLAIVNDLMYTQNGSAVPIFYVTHTLTEEGLFLDHVDLLSLQGIVTLNATLVPYLIEYLEKHAPSSDPFTPLLSSTTSPKKMST